ncbi:nucleoporin subcomplex protein binding to Pom34-domain-containing protein [Fimicolochytrium jonesii]|uniref:nucleoporin subcomplex protein binding to Pom34-domain-containing protein n=1 Tax=Fimicolochytrium jonesii TaxID=1396493 RepID=UPI0022FE6D32|nr:nucleoporin subcomplex protein binding to Pom34-domain-containing protein [Fimicolochytrium jonesii]KAI8817534.1 nucleoporin subcomplex protein binding to Pom34-domain-containing protein [Fimicolochytrium jonesii]
MAAQARPGNIPFAVSAKTAPPKEKIRTWTRKGLWQAIENEGERNCTRETFVYNLNSHREALLGGIGGYKAPNEESARKVRERAEKPKADFLAKMSTLMHLDAVQCESILETCIKDDLEAPAVRRRIDWSQMKQINYNDEMLVVAMQQQYLNEREETLLALVAIIRAADDEEHRFYEDILTFVQGMFQDSEAAGERLLKQLDIVISGEIPPQVAADPEWARTWANQFVREQRVLLQIIFLVYYSVAPCSSTLASRFLRSLIEDFDFGRSQSNESLLNEEASAITKHISDLCVMVSIELMRLNELIDATNLDTAPFADSPDAIKQIYGAIEHSIVASHGRSDPIAPVMMAWGVLMQAVHPYLEQFNDGPQAEVCKFIEENVNIGVPYSRTPQLLVQQAYLAGQAIPYLIGALRGPMVVDVHIALGYKSIIKDMLMLLLETVEDASALPDREVFLQCLSCLFTNEEQLGLEWWEHDYGIPERRSLLDTARRAFPIEFSSLVQLLSSTISSSRTAAYVFRYFKSLPTFADFYRPYDYQEDPFRENESGSTFFAWNGYSQGIVYGARDLILGPPEQCEGQLIHDDPKILLLRFNYSGWHLLFSMMDSFLHGAGLLTGLQPSTCTSGKPEHIADILKLLNTFLQHADETLLSEFIAHVSMFTTTLATWGEKTAEHFVGLICQVLNRACTFATPPIQLLTSAMTCLSLLLPYFPDAVWKHLRIDGLFPRYSAAIRLSSANSYMEEVLLPAEIAAGLYPTTMAFLDLVSALIKDAQTLRPQAVSLSPAEHELEAEFWRAQGDAQLREAFDAKVGGVDNRLRLEKKLIAHARIRDSAVLKSEVLFSAVVYIHSQLFPKHGGWRYVHLQHKYQLGLKILQIFNQIMFDSSWAHEESPSRSAALVDFSAVQQYLARGYLADGSMYQLAPLIDIVSLGNDVPLRFYRELRMQSARTSEECIENALLFVKSLLKRRKLGGMNISLLEHALLDRTVQTNGTQSDPVELVQVLGRYISYQNHRPLPLLAAEVLTLLCAVAADWQPAQPSFAGYLGLDAYHFVSSVIKGLTDTSSSASSSEELQTALYNLVTIVIATQPGLGAMLLTGEAAQPTLPSSVAELYASTSKPPSGSSQDLPELSVLTPALALLTRWKNVLDEAPSTLPAAMRLMDALWQNAPQYMVMLDKLRARAEFWSSLDEVFSDDPPEPTEEPLVGLEPRSLSEEHTQLRRFCYGKLVRTYALRILAFEVYFSKGMQGNSAALRAVKTVFEKQNAQGQLALFTDDSTLPIKSDLPLEVLDLVGHLNIPLSLPAYKLLNWSDDLDVDSQFGDNYVYDLELLRAKMSGHIQYRADDEEQETYAEFLSRLCALNHNRSMTDAHIALVRAWKQFLKVYATMYLAGPGESKGRTAPTETKLSANQIYQLITRLTETLVNDHRTDGAAITYRTEISNLLLFLVAVWDDLIKERPLDTNAKEAADIVKRLHHCMSAETYILGPRGTLSEYPFHVELLAAIGAGLRTLRANTQDGKTKVAPEIRETMQLLLPVVSKGLSLLLKGLGPEQYIKQQREVNVTLTCFTEIMGFSEYLDPTSAIATMDRYEVVQLLVVVLQKAVSETFEEWPMFAHDLLFAMLAIAETPLGAERLAAENIVVYLSNNSMTPALNQGLISPYIDTQRRNPWHKVWCAMLSLSTRVVQFLGYNPTLVEEATGFIRVYQTQITKAIDVRVDGNIPLARIEEILRISELFYTLCSWANQPDAELDAMAGNSGGADYAILDAVIELALQVLGYFAFLLDNPYEMHHRIASVGTGVGLAGLGSDWDLSAVLPLSQQQQKAATNRTTTAGESDSSQQGIPSTQLSIDATRSLLLVVRNFVGYFRLYLDADHLLVTKEEQDWDRKHVFEATMSVHGGQGATMGTLFGLVRRMNALLSKDGSGAAASGESNNGGSEVDKTLQDAANALPPIELVLIGESAFTLAITEFALYKRAAETDEVLKELRGEADATFKATEAALRGLSERQGRGSEKEKKDAEKALAFCKILEKFWGSVK